MSWLRDDDDMLDHEKWRRAIRDGGDGALLVWARLRAWCSRRLTDGLVPADMVDEVAEIGRSRSRARALRALVAHELCTRDARGALTICGYLERNPSAASVRAERGRRAEAQRKRRLAENVTGHAPTSEPERNEVPSRPVPAQSRPIQDTPVCPHKTERAVKPRRALWHRVPESWAPDEKTMTATRALLGDRFETELQKFKDWEFKDGKSDADAAWRNWARRSSEQGPLSGGRGGRQPTLHQPNAGKTGWE